jgi:uncharacterized repeat protein (TIGR01451 family)
MKYLLPSLCLLLLFSLAQAQNYSLRRSVGPTVISSSGESFTVDSQGYLYVSSSNGYIAKMDGSGQLKQIIYPTFAEDVYNTPSGVTVDKDGNIWSLDLAHSRVWKFDASGKPLLTLYQDPDIILQSLRDVWADEQGNIHLLNEYVLQKIDAKGNLLLRFSVNPVELGGGLIPNSLAMDKQGNYWIADVAKNSFYKYDSQGNFLLKVGSYGEGDGQFYSCTRISVDSQGNIWTLDYANARVQKFDPTGKFLSKFGTKGKQDGQFNVPWDMHIDKQDNIWILDAGRIQKFNPEGKFLSSTSFYGSANGQLMSTKGVAVDLQGNTWVVDENARVQKFDANGKFITSIGTQGEQDGQFKTPQNVETDQQNNVWVADTYNHRIQKFSPNGKFLAKIGSWGQSNGQFTNPSDIAIDKDGNIWVADTYNHRIQKFDSNGRFLLKTGSYGANDGQFASPLGIAADKDGNIWVADTYNHRIQKFDSNGRFLLKSGVKGQQEGQMNLPWSIAVDPQGRIWVADSENRRFQQFDPAGNFLSIFRIGNLKPFYLTFDRYGNLYSSSAIGVAMYDNSSVKTLIKGKVFFDQNQNCVMENTEKPIADMIMRATPGNYYGVTDSKGDYQIQVDTGTYTVSQVGINTKGKSIEYICPATNLSPAVVLKSKGDSVTNVNFADKLILAPHLVTSIHSTRRRRCFTNTTVISYANTGYTDASEVKVYVQLPEQVLFKSADKAYIQNKTSQYVFTIGTLKANESGSITITDSVACTANARGLTACTKVWITPSNGYTLPKDSQWDQSDIVLSGKCIENGRTQLVIKNTGQPMADSSQFRVFLDAQLAFQKNYQLSKGDSLVLRVPAGGKTVRLEADQRPDHPRKSQTNITIEGCVASPGDLVSKGFVNLLPQDDWEDEVAIECLPITDSFDPNDKLVSPSGTTGDHFTPTQSELKYTIRFQNTGTDYAYTVTVIDTLSEKLDISTFQMGAASHKYAFTVSGKGKPVLTFTFNNINLPDSTRNQAGSNGFVQFSIKPKAGLSEKARIENFADIIFDYNEPVRTNTTVNVLYDVPRIIDPQNQLPESIIDRVLAIEPQALKGKLNVYPNPTRNKVQIQSVDASVRIEQIQVSNLLGELQAVDSVRTSNQAIQVSMQGKARGMYLIRIQTSKGILVQRVVVQ